MPNWYLNSMGWIVSFLRYAALRLFWTLSGPGRLNVIKKYRGGLNAHSAHSAHTSPRAGAPRSRHPRLERFRNWCRPKRRPFSWFSSKENHTSRSLSGHSNCETALTGLARANPVLRLQHPRVPPTDTRCKGSRLYPAPALYPRAVPDPGRCSP
jgi:hypothetical protein